MTRPTRDPYAWASDATWTSGPNSGDAPRDSALSAGVAAQGIVAGQALKADQINEMLHSCYEWLQYLRTERGRGWCGDGSTGDATITGGTTTLSSHVYYDDLTITSTGVLVPSQYIVFVRGVLTIEPGGRIHADGTSAAAGTAGSPPPSVPGGAGAAGSSYLPHGGVDGAEGTFDAYGGNSNGDPASTTLFTSFYRSLGGAGGAGGASGGGATGGAGSPTTAPLWPVRHAAFWLAQIGRWISDTDDAVRYYGGGGGGEGGFSGVSGTKGAGGGGAGMLVICANRVVNEGAISANGGAGGAAYSLNSTGIGGGGGGGAGAAVVLSGEYSGAGTITATGGAGGAATGTGVAGTAGAAGLALQLLI